MEPIQWLVNSVPEFNKFSLLERNAIGDFVLLWSLFESRVLDTNANADKIIDVGNRLRAQQNLNLEGFQTAIGYFRKRYYKGGNFTPAFERLLLRGNDHSSLVKKVISGQTSDDAEILSAILIIVLRLRNNLFHGNKWSYEIQGQLKNFRNSNSVLMAVMDLHES